MGTQPHRLPRESYRGTVSASFSLCIAGRKQAFLDEALVDMFISVLRRIAETREFRGIYCFMPDHLHLILLGINEQSDVLRAVVDFKQRSGYWLKHERPIFAWQKSFHDHLIRAQELGVHVRYVLDNPVRKGLVREWREYRFIGAIGMDLETFLEGMGPD